MSEQVTVETDDDIAVVKCGEDVWAFYAGGEFMAGTDVFDVLPPGDYVSVERCQRLIAVLERVVALAKEDGHCALRREEE